MRLTEALDQGQSAIHFRIRVIKLFATLFLDEVAGAVNRQFRRDVVKDGTQLKLGPSQNRIGLAPREEHRKFELAQTPDPVPVGERIGRTRVLFQRVKANQRRRQGLVGGEGWIRTPVPRGLRWAEFGPCLGHYLARQKASAPERILFAWNSALLQLFPASDGDRSMPC